MLNTIAGRMGGIRTHLTRLDRQPLGRAALMIVLLLDAFILSSIFDGLERHTAQLAQPHEIVPESCRQIVLDERWNPSNRLERLAAIAATQDQNPYSAQRKKRLARHPVCEPLIAALDAVSQDRELRPVFADIRKIREHSGDLRTQIERLKGSYDTALLEAIARPGETHANAEALGNDLRTRTDTLNVLTQKLAGLEAAAQDNRRVQKLWLELDAVSESARQRLRADLWRLDFWYPVKRLGMEMIFLLPLLGLFYAWNLASIRNSRPVQTLVSSHLLVIAVIPVLCKIIQLVYDILPRKFLHSLVVFLESLKLIAVWHYLAMALAIAATLALIYVVQNKLFSREKLLARRISRGLCQDCGRPLAPGSAACPLCGFVQFKPCPHCGKPAHVFGSYCADCGKPLA